MRMQRLMLTLAIAMAMPAHAAGTDVTEEMTAAMREARAELREARNELRALTRRIGELQRRTGELDGKTLSFTYLSDPKRAMVGVVLDQRDDGVFIAAVTPGGPAEKAGIRAGDKLVSVGGKAIAQPADGKARTPGEALFADGSVVQARDLIGRLEPGQKVDLVVERDGKRQSLQVAAERRESWDWPMLAGSMPALAPLAEIAPMTVTVPNVRVIVERGEGDGGVHTEVIDREIAGNIDREMRRVMVMRGGALFDLKLSPVNPDLGRYFGTDSGVLVLDKGSDTLKELRTGDVITSIAGRRVESTTDAMRALADHEAGSTVNVEVMRDRKRTVLVVEVPERDAMDFMIPAPPAPPAPPSAPRAPAPAPKAAPAPAPMAVPAPPAPPSPPPPGRVRTVA